MRAALLAATCFLAVVAMGGRGHADGLTVAYIPNGDPLQASGCAIYAQGPELRVAEFRGYGLAPIGPFRWYASRNELTAFRAALDALAGGEYLATDPVRDARQVPPYFAIFWSVETSGGIRAGHVRSNGLDPPELIAALLGIIAPESHCVGLG